VFLGQRCECKIAANEITKAVTFLGSARNAISMAVGFSLLIML
jgi:hypothetical protein